jgi:hypothetical protein
MCSMALEKRERGDRMAHWKRDCNLWFLWCDTHTVTPLSTFGDQQTKLRHRFHLALESTVVTICTALVNNQKHNKQLAFSQSPRN